MAFEALTDKFKGLIRRLKGTYRLSESNMDEMIKEIRVALLEADVNYKVVKEFTNNIKEKAIGQKVIDTMNPSQMILKIIHEELVNLLGSEESELKYPSNRPIVIMMVGLQGTGKTTTVGKLAYLMKNKLHKKVLLAACDTYRPAAIEQLATLAKSVGVDLVNMGDSVSPVEIANVAKKKAFDEKYDALIIDTAGRLTIDDELMEELNNIKTYVNPDEILLLVDAMSGQDAVNVANSFNELLSLTGIVMSKLDGDSRGGAALSIKHMTGVPIKFSGVGEKITDLDIFYPDRMADRILGMGDVMTLVEKAQEEFDEKTAKKTVNKMFSGDFGLEDMLEQLASIKKLGSLRGLLKMIPGMPKISDDQIDMAEKEMRNFEVIMSSMTQEEKDHPEIIKYSRKQRICNGCGKQISDLNRMLNKFEQSKEQMKKLADMKKSGRFPGGFGGMNFPF